MRGSEDTLQMGGNIRRSVKFERYSVRILAGEPAFLTAVFHLFPQPRRQIPGKYLHWDTTASFPKLYNSYIILPSGAI
jgi:hypothetical protein